MDFKLCSSTVPTISLQIVFQWELNNTFKLKYRFSKVTPTQLGTY